MKCDYGCESDAQFKFQNGKHCCSKNVSQCQAIRKIPRKSNSELFKNFPKKICKFCGKHISYFGIKRHEQFCYLNPENLKLCPVCNNPIINWKNNTTCSIKCAGEYFKDQRFEISETHWSKKENRIKMSIKMGGTGDINGRYRFICFNSHKKECIICGEKNIVEVHHYDFSHDNDSIINLIPLCPTHHDYCHSRYYHLIEEEIWLYYLEFLSEQLCLLTI